jgi:hypothetical protein
MNAPKPTVARQFKANSPMLRPDVFSGTGQRYWRVVGGQCQLVEVQGSRYGGKFAVNMRHSPDVRAT